jgi:hypothetical protein
MNRIAPAGYELVRRISTSDCAALGESLQKNPSVRRSQLVHSSVPGTPYEVPTLFGTVLKYVLSRFVAIKVAAMG